MGSEPTLQYSIAPTHVETTRLPFNVTTATFMNDISFVDTTLRDGQQSLWALGMKTDGHARRRRSDGPGRLRVFGVLQLQHDQEIRA